MTYLVDKKIEFLHVPKTGGTWLTLALSKSDCEIVKINRTHAHHDDTLYLKQLGSGSTITKLVFETQYKRLINGSAILNTRPKFFMVRHPFDWYESWWKYSLKYYVPALRHRKFDAIHRNGLVPANENEDFNSFIACILVEHPGYLTSNTI